MDVPDAKWLKILDAESARLKCIVAEPLLVIDGMKEIVRKKMTTPTARRKAIDSLVRRGVP